jgi:hypothetical protein
MLQGGCGRITRQLGNIENNTIFCFIILCFKISFVTMEVSCVISGMTQKKAKHMREITV